jgi:hypothetical protein
MSDTSAGGRRTLRGGSKAPGRRVSATIKGGAAGMVCSFELHPDGFTKSEITQPGKVDPLRNGWRTLIVQA